MAAIRIQNIQIHLLLLLHHLKHVLSFNLLFPLHRYFNKDLHLIQLWREKNIFLWVNNYNYCEKFKFKNKYYCKLTCFLINIAMNQVVIICSTFESLTLVCSSKFFFFWIVKKKNEKHISFLIHRRFFCLCYFQF